ncbi:MAG: hypothetical protein D6815_12185 [Candidatus Dadabacteria bacterium]|nr:MAG: hypothetical protein D6815_12185 [Candidatus Dadabacteria bacterium]
MTRKLRLRLVSLHLCSGLLLSALALTGCRGSRPPLERHPGRNVVLITIDTLRADHVGFYHYERPTTPNIDRLAARSISFGNAVSPSSWTLPAHASLLTGLQPAEHGVVADVNALPRSAPTLATILSRHGYQTFAAVSHVYLGHRWGFDRGFDVFDETAAADSPHRPVAARIVNKALAWLEQRRTDRPFFMWLHIFDPHWDYSPPPPYDRMFDPDYRGSMRGDYESLKPYIKEVAHYETPPPLAPRDLQHVVALYDGEIAYVDAQLGRLFERLEQPDLATRTVIVLVADHGEEFMEHGSLEGHQWTLYDEVLLVPWILHFPEERFAGLHFEPEVSTVTLAGTLLDYLGIEHTKPSLYRMVADPHYRWPDPVVLSDLTVRRQRRLVALRLTNFKLIEEVGGPAWLYRIPHRGEKENVIDRYPRIASRMRAKIDEILASLKPLPDAGAMREPLDAATRERLRATGYLR